MTVAAPLRPLEEPPAPWRSRIRPPVPVGAAGGWVATLAIGLVAGLLRFIRLDIPGTGVDKGKIFDEIYYSCDAQNLLRFGVEHATRSKNAGCVPTPGAAFIVHPPLGKWLIALGEQLFGVNTFGWRSAAAAAGTVTVVILVRLARRMTGSTLLGCIAGLLLALDGLHFVQSRVAMLDIFLCLWTTAAAACLVVDRDAVRTRLAGLDGSPEGPPVRLGRRPWLVACGACLGAAVATKWSGLYDLAALLALAVFWEAGARRTAGARTPYQDTLRRSLPALLTVFLVLPAFLYVASWSGWFLTGIGYDRHWAHDHPGGTFGFLPDALRSWWQYHREIYGFHAHLQAKHPYQSHPAGWLLLARPVSYYYPQSVGPGVYGCTVASCSREVLAIGTPAIWWVSIIALLVCAWKWLSARDWRAGAVLLLAAAGIVPWEPDDLHQRTMFLFYALPSVPFLCLALTLAIGWAVGGPSASPRRRAAAATGAGVYLSLVVLNFVYLYPVLAAQTIPYASWHSRMWFPSWI